MFVRVAKREDYCAWLDLAAEVEPLFGPMVDDPVFRRVLSRNLGRGSAYCIREHDGPAGSRLVAGLLLSVHPPVHRIGWLAVARSYRRSGFGTALVEHIIRKTPPSAELLVVTFGSGVRGGEPARRFYERMGFIPAETVEPGPGGTPRQAFRRPIETVPADARSEAFVEQPASGS
ncbi:MAG: GNAT family N-acetyltransferase [Candidatus Bipolaricaulis sp.]|nr:GNAT family N-acetyltransferase [Candidatus Bipolaricaulis sp.]